MQHQQHHQQSQPEVLQQQQQQQQSRPHQQPEQQQPPASKAPASAALQGLLAKAPARPPPLQMELSKPRPPPPPPVPAAPAAPDAPGAPFETVFVLAPAFLRRLCLSDVPCLCSLHRSELHTPGLAISSAAVARLWAEGQGSLPACPYLPVNV